MGWFSHFARLHCDSSVKVPSHPLKTESAGRTCWFRIDPGRFHVSGQEGRWQASHVFPEGERKTGSPQFLDLAMVQNQWYHVGVGEFTTHFRTYFSGWIGALTHGHLFPVCHFSGGGTGPLNSRPVGSLPLFRCLGSPVPVN